MSKIRWLTVVVIILYQWQVLAQKHIVHIAIFAPERSPWMKAMDKMKAAIAEQSQGRLIIRFYPGGVAGNDREVLEKIANGRLDGAGVTGIGLGQILPEIRVLEWPFAFSSYRQFDAVSKRLASDFAAKLRKSGYRLLGWTDQGFVYIMSKHNITSVAAMVRTRPWVWKQDPLARATAQTFGASPIALEPNQVADALRAGTVDTIYMTPLATIFLQWYPQLDYFLELPVANALGALIVSQKKFAQLPPDLQRILERQAARYTKKLVTKIRDLNDKAILVLRKKQIHFIRLPPEQCARFRDRGTQAAQSLVGKLYSSQLLDQVRQLLRKSRK